MKAPAHAIVVITLMVASGASGALADTLAYMECRGPIWNNRLDERGLFSTRHHTVNSRGSGSNSSKAAGCGSGGAGSQNRVKRSPDRTEESRLRPHRVLIQQTRRTDH
jgi:hypothetical protein